MPDSALDNWRRWRCGIRQRPRVVRELAGGLTNRTFLLEAAGQEGSGRRLVLRQNNRDEVAGGHPRQHPLGIDRVRESKILKAAAASGIAPVVYYCAPDEGVLVTEFIEGDPLRPPDLTVSGKQKLLRLVEQVHKLQVACSPMNYLDYAEDYWRRIEDRGIAVTPTLLKKRESMLPLLASFQSSNQAMAICHHDPVPENIIDTGDKLYLLDWEYAAPGHPAYDYAVINDVWQVDLGVKVSPSASLVYQYICELWHLLR